MGRITILPTIALLLLGSNVSLQAGKPTKLYHQAAVQSQQVRSTAPDSDEIDQEIDKYFDQLTNARSVDVDEQRLEKMFQRKPRTRKGDSVSFNNSSGVNETKTSTPDFGIESHTVVANDTLYGIGKKYGVDPEVILQHNPMLKKRPLYIGEEVLITKIETRTPTRRRYTRYYRVRSGDTLSHVSRKYGVSIAALKRWNSMKTAAIKIGQRLKVGTASKTSIPRGFAMRAMFEMPVDGRITSRFGRRRNPFDNAYRSFHKGIDIGVKLGTPFLAAREGIVILARRMGGYGNCIFIRHSDGYVSVYAHGKKINVRRGDVVQRGQVIGYVGRTGNATGPHLHFEVRRRKQAINPLTAFRQQELVPHSVIKKAALK